MNVKIKPKRAKKDPKKGFFKKEKIRNQEVNLLFVFLKTQENIFKFIFIIKHSELTCPLMLETRPPYWSFGGGKTLPRTSIILLLIVRPNSCT